MRASLSNENPAYEALRAAFAEVMDHEKRCGNEAHKDEVRDAIRECEARLAKLPFQLTRHTRVWLDEQLLERESSKGPLCDMMIPERGRLAGSGYIAALLLKVLIVAHVEAHPNQSPIDLTVWRKEANQDPCTPGLKCILRGNEHLLSKEFLSLIRATPKDGRTRFTDLCRPCVEAMAGTSRDLANELFGESLVAILTSTSSDAASKTDRANALSKLGKALQHKVDFLKNGGRKK